MSGKHLTSWLFFVCFLAVISHASAADAETVYLPAEEMTSPGEMWQVKEHFTGWYHGRPHGDMLVAARGKQGEASAHARVNDGGDYRLWVRYLGVSQYRGPFEVRIMQNDEVVASHTFDENKPDSIRGYASFVWASMSVTLEPGNVRISVHHDGTQGNMWLTRHLDALALSNEQDEAPSIQSFVDPLYVQVEFHEAHPEPSVIHVFGRRPFSPWYVPHHNLGSQGLVKGAVPGTGKHNKLAPGESSPWVNVTPLLAIRGLNRVEFAASRAYTDLVDNAAFTLRFSTTPSNAGLLAEFERTGPGGALLVTIDQTQRDQIRSEKQWSAEARAHAERLPDVPGRRARRFPLGTGVALSSEKHTQTAIDNEIAVMEALGINAVKTHSGVASAPGIAHGYASQFIYHLSHNRNIAEPKHDQIRARLDKALGQLAESPLNDAVVNFNLMDEPAAPSIEQLAGSKVARQRFVEYLQTNSFSPADFNADDWTDIKPTKSQDNPLLYVQSVQFRSQVMADFFAFATRHIEPQRPDLRTTTNFASSFSYHGNLLHRGADWFRNLRQGALTYGWSEDWLNHSTTYQFSGMLCDMMRAATRPNDQPFGMYNILRWQWEIPAKAAAEIGRGADALYYFNYGPYYAVTSDQRSHREELYGVLRRLNYAIGAVEDVIVDAEVPRACVAQLYAHSTDIWTLDTPFSAPGKERLHLWLIARHLNRPIDILTESDVADGQLEPYDALLLPGTHVTRKSAEAVAAWVRDGGILIITPGSAQRDRLNRPLSMLKDLGINAPTLDNLRPAGRDIYEMAGQKPVKQVQIGDQTLPAIIATQSYAPANGTRADVLARFNDDTPAATRFHVGEGQVIAMHFFPGLTYGHMAVNAYKTETQKNDATVNDQLPCAQSGHYPAAIRALLKEALNPLGPTTIESSEPLVQADVLQGKDANLLVLSNWTGQSLDAVTITLRGQWAEAANINAIQTDQLTVQRNDDELTITLPVGPFEFVELR